MRKTQLLAGGHRLKSGSKITISTDRFKCLYAIKCSITDQDDERLADKLRELATIEARDFVNGI